MTDAKNNMTDILKGISAIWLRLFDHKVFLHGEVQFTLREYEQKRNDIEVEQLFFILEKAEDIKGAQIYRVQQSVNLTLSESERNLKEALDICDSIADLERTYEKDSTLKLHRQNNKLEWEQFVDSMTTNCTYIDSTFQQKEVELQKLYDDLRIKLNTPASK